MTTASSRFSRGTRVRILDVDTLSDWLKESSLTESEQDAIVVLASMTDPFTVTGYADSIHVVVSHPASEDTFSMPHWLFMATYGTHETPTNPAQDYATASLAGIMDSIRIPAAIFSPQEIAGKPFTRTVQVSLTPEYERGGWPIPGFSREGDAGIDLRAVEKTVVAPNAITVVPTGVRVAIPPGFVGLVFPRSGFSIEHRFSLGGGVIDANYRGEIKCIINSTSPFETVIEAGERFAQLVVVNQGVLAVEVVDELSPSNRGTAGYGSSGKV